MTHLSDIMIIILSQFSVVEKGKVIHKNDEYWGKKVDNAVDNDGFIHKNPMRWHVEKWISLIHNCG